MKITSKLASEILPRWFKATEGEILSWFADLSDKSCVIGKGDFQSVFVPGERDDKVLLVAHVDTVWNDSPKIELAYDGGLFYSANRQRGLGKKHKKPTIQGIGIGADDRAGCAAVWQLRELGHSLLITGGEEHGCLGSTYLMTEPDLAWAMQQHQFAVQFDRRGRNDLVFYNVGSKKFMRYCEQQTGYQRCEGFSTDICVLCEEICGVNISIGYRNEHTCSEVLSTRYWSRTVNTAFDWLSAGNLPRFQLRKD